MGDLPGISAFSKTAEHLSFRRAADELGISPAAVSKAIASLEERLGVQLLERTSRRVALTPEGATYLEHCRVALDALTAGRDAVLASHRAPSGRISWTLSIIIARLVVKALPSFSERYPRLSLDVRITDRFVRLLEEDVDVAVRVGELADSSMTSVRLASTHRVFVASPAYLAIRGTPRQLDELSDHDCLKFRGPRGALVEWEAAERTKSSNKARTIATPTSHSFDHGELLVDAAAAGMGLVQAFDFMVQDKLRTGELVEVLPAYRAPGPPIVALCRPRRSRTPKVRASLDFLKETIRRPE